MPEKVHLDSRKQQLDVLDFELSETDHHQKVSPACLIRKKHMERFCDRCDCACNAGLEAVAEADLLLWYETV